MTCTTMAMAVELVATASANTRAMAAEMPAVPSALRLLRDHIAARPTAATAAAAAEVPQELLVHGPAIGTTETLTADEIAAQTVSADRLARLAAVFAEEGMVIVDGLFPHDVLDRLQAKLDTDAAHQWAKKALTESADAANSTRHLANGLPREAPWTVPEVVANPLVEQVVAAVLGGAAFIRYVEAV
eukprot:SAG22_NODE_451_length_10354_cov_5.184983_9_plen_187_part_00